MTMLLAILGLFALYFVVHMYFNSEAPKNNDRRPETKATHEEGILDKRRLEKTRQEAREFLNKQPPLNTRKPISVPSIHDKGYRFTEYQRREQERKRDERAREERRRRDETNDIVTSTSFFTSANTPSPSSSPDCGPSHSHHDHSPSSSSDSICSFD